MEEEGQVNCSNCNKPQVASKIHLHEAYCLRNFKKCPDCDEFIDKRELESHKQEKHTQQQCKYCSQPFLPKDIATHLKTCDLRPQKCPYCTLDVAGVDYGEHIKDCGSRTRECFICNKSIILFNFEEHVDTCVGAPQNVPYESQFPSHTQAFKPKPNKPQNIKPYLPQSTNIASQRVHIGGTGSQQAKKDNQLDKADEDFARRLQQADQNNDTELLKNLQEEEDERLARELNKDFSPKNKQAQNIPKPPQNKPAQQFDDYDYNYEEEDNDYHGYEDEDMDKQDEEMNQAQQYQQGLNNPLVFPQYQKPAEEKSKEVKEMEELGEFIEDDPELQQAIFQSQQQK